MTEPAAPAAPGAAYRPSDPDVETTCANCGARLAGPFCAQCGQEARDPDPTARELFQEAFEEFSTVDSKLLRTIRALLTQPGVLTVEYVAGRRQRYVAPLKLYLWTSVLFFFVAAVIPDAKRTVRLGAGDDPQKAAEAATADSLAAARRRDSVLATVRDRATRARLSDSMRVADSVAAAARVRESERVRLQQQAALDSAARALDSDSTQGELVRRIAAGFKRGAAHPEQFQEAVGTWTPRAFFALVPLFAALLALVYRSRRVRYPRHLFFSLHVHAYVFAVMLVVQASGALGSEVLSGLLAFAALIAIPTYIVRAMRRVYGGTTRATLARSAMLTALYLPTLMLAMVVIIVIAAATM